MTIIDEKNLLTDEQKEHLLESASLGFKLGGYTSLADILDKLDVTVYVVPGIVKRSTKYLDATKEYWEKKLKSQKESEIACRNLKIISAELQAVSCEYLRGCYIHEQKEILLFPEEMEQEKKYDGKRMNELLVSTLAHETMHAYFNRTDHDSFPYVYFVEESLAEFGMLVFLKETEIPYLDWAYDDVHGKRTCYRYGASLYDKFNGGDSSLRDYLKEYKIYIDEFYIPDVVGGSICLPTSSSHCSAPRIPHPIRHSLFGLYGGKIYECIFEKNYVHGRMSNIFKSKYCLFTIPTQCYNLNASLFRLFYDDTTKTTVSSMEMTIVDNTWHSLMGTGKASVMRNHTINILKPLQSDFQNKYICRNCVGGTLDVSFYKNVSNNHDWVLMVK